MKSNFIVKLFSLSGVIGVIFYFLHVFIGKMFYGNYNSMAQAISDLTSSDSPSKI